LKVRRKKRIKGYLRRIKRLAFALPLVFGFGTAYQILVRTGFQQEEGSLT